MARIYYLIFFVLLLFAAVPFSTLNAQAQSYEVIPAPDLWYNDVDGIRLGVRVKGQVPGTFEDGPHRLDAGIWLGTWFPDLPVSYYLSYTNPIQAWSEFGSETSLQLISSIRTGYHLHGAGINKRWQEGFDERRYKELSLFHTYENRFDDEYVQFPVLWSDDDKLLLKLTAELQDDNTLGWYNVSLAGSVQYLDDTYSSLTLTGIQRVPFNENWGLRFRGYFGVASSGAAPEYLFSRSTDQAVNWIDSGITRAKGTIPQPWMTSGNFHTAGGANLRGYTSQDIAIFDSQSCINCDEIANSQNAPVLFRSFAAINSELDYYNPINKLFNELPYISDFLSFRSYLFLDTGRSLNLNKEVDDDIVTEDETLFSNAGAGFSLSLNIPDYLGKPRGFVLRYEIPFWLSEPGDEDSLKLRHLFGFGAVISF